MGEVLPAQAIEVKTALITPSGRPFRSGLPTDLLSAIQAGTLKTRYRGKAMSKSPFDVILYMQLFEKLSPNTIIEIGTKQGGSALWFADLASAAGRSPQVITIDRAPMQDLGDARITFIQGNAKRLEESLSDKMLQDLPRPWLISEDSAHRYDTCLAVLEFFDRYLKRGDYIVIEDGIVNDMSGDFARYENGPNRAVAEFLAKRRDAYEIDTGICDFFGFNCTYNPNGWLQRK